MIILPRAFSRPAVVSGVLTLFLMGMAPSFLPAQEEVLKAPQTFLVTSANAPLMAGEEQAGTVPLGSVLQIDRVQAGWRYCPDRRGWVHIRDLIPLEQAVATFTEEIEKKPTPRAHQLRGIAYMAHQQWARAAQDFEQAYDLGESAVAVHLNLGTCYERLQQFPAAMAEYDIILKTYPDDFDATFARGNLLLQQGQFEAARRDLTKATELDPKSASAWNAQGVSLRMLGRYENAILAYSKSLELDETAADALSNRGYAHKQLGKLAEAQQDYEAAVQLAPDSAPIRNDLAWFLATTSDEKLRNGERAVEISEAVCRETRNRNGEYLDTLAAAYASTGRYPAAVEAARLALTVLGENPGAERTRERLALYQQGQPYIESVAAADTGDAVSQASKLDSENEKPGEANPASKSTQDPSPEQQTKSSDESASRAES